MQITQTHLHVSFMYIFTHRKLAAGQRGKSKSKRCTFRVVTQEYYNRNNIVHLLLAAPGLSIRLLILVLNLLNSDSLDLPDSDLSAFLFFLACSINSYNNKTHNIGKLLKDLSRVDIYF